jgi:hypothetical protein
MIKAVLSEIETVRRASRDERVAITECPRGPWPSVDGRTRTTFNTLLGAGLMFHAATLRADVA